MYRHRKRSAIVVFCGLSIWLGFVPAGAEEPVDELRCIVEAFEKVQAYWLENQYRGKLYYEGDDPETFNIYLDRPPVGYSFFGSGPQQKYNKMLEILFSDDEDLLSRFHADCAR